MQPHWQVRLVRASQAIIEIFTPSTRARPTSVTAAMMLYKR